MTFFLFLKVVRLSSIYVIFTFAVPPLQPPLTHIHYSVPSKVFDTAIILRLQKSIGGHY